MYYDPSASSTSKVVDPATPVTLNLGEYTEMGVWMTDQVCIASESCNEDSESVNVQFLSVTSTSNFDNPFDGLFGLAPLGEGKSPGYIS